MPTGRQLQHRALAAAAAREYGGVLSRRVLRELGVDRHEIRAEVAQARWRMHGSQTVAVHTGVLGPLALRWRAIWEVGERIAALDRASGLHAAGMTGYDVDVIQVSVPHGCTPPQVDGVAWRKVTRLEGELVGAGIPRVRPAIAAVRGARRAVSDRQAALLLVLPVQQRIITGSALLGAARTVRGKGRSAFIRDIARAVAEGAQTLGELDFGRLCVARGLPRPDRQVVVTLPDGRVYLDVRWRRVRLVVEIDGAGHLWGLTPTYDNLRQNALTLRGDAVLRIDVIGLRLQTDAFMDQVCLAHALLADCDGPGLEM